MKLKHDNRSISIPFLKSSMAGLIRRIMIREFFSLNDGSYIQRIPVSDFTTNIHLLTLLITNNSKRELF
ncbi:hypothetical protein LEP1GSC162_2529 [Leptospira santarosai str. CBC1531]|nr:hypothetical protein LEP1GSC162_2529 [Leptospira santarosai str. CBC1531]